MLTTYMPRMCKRTWRLALRAPLVDRNKKEAFLVYPRFRFFSLPPSVVFWSMI